MVGYNFTDRVRTALQGAREEATSLHHPYVAPEHVLLGLLRTQDGLAARVLTDLGVPPATLRQQTLEVVKRGSGSPPEGPDLPYTSGAKKVLEFAMTEARELQHSRVGTEHLLLGLLRQRKGLAAEVLERAGLSLAQARLEVSRLVPPQAKAPPKAPASEPIPRPSPGLARPRFPPAMQRSLALALIGLVLIALMVALATVLIR